MPEHRDVQIFWRRVHRVRRRVVWLMVIVLTIDAEGLLSRVHARQIVEMDEAWA